jgi:hypothetical protein
MHCLIVVANGRFTSGNTGRLFYDDKVCRLSPLLSQDSKGEPSSVMRWMVSIITWTRTTLKSRFKFRTKPPLGVQASDASDLSTVGYLLELLCDRSPFGVTMHIRWPPFVGSTQALVSISRWSSDESGSGVDADEDELDAPAKGQRMDVTTGIPQTILAVRM